VKSIFEVLGPEVIDISPLALGYLRKIDPFDKTIQPAVQLVPQVRPSVLAQTEMVVLRFIASERAYFIVSNKSFAYDEHRKLEIAPIKLGAERLAPSANIATTTNISVRVKPLLMLD
jgi:hypothetical protein